MTSEPIRHNEYVAAEVNAHLPEAQRARIHGEGLRALKALGQKGLSGRKILLVGGAGYIGSVVTDHLLRRGYAVRCIDRLLYGNQSAVLPSLGSARYEFLYGDITDRRTIGLALEGITDVVLLAGLVGDPITKKYPQQSAVINDQAVQQVIDSCQGLGLNKLIFISTCSNYGLASDNVLLDEDADLRPLSLYAKSKVAAELKLLSLRDKVDYHPTILRFATAFGLSPRMRFDLTISEFTRTMFRKEELLVFDPHTWRPYCHVQDFAEVIRRVLEAPVDDVRFEVFNAGGDVNNFTKQMIVETIQASLPDSLVRYQTHGSDPRNYRVSFAKIRQRLFFEPTKTVRDGVSELIGALRLHLFDDVEARPNFFGNYEIAY